MDTGIRYTHQDLAPNIWRNPGETGFDAQGHDKATNGIDDDGDGYVDNVYGMNAITGSGNPLDDHDHGTHVAGIAAAVANNGAGIAGISAALVGTGVHAVMGIGGAVLVAPGLAWPARARAGGLAVVPVAVIAVLHLWQHAAWLRIAGTSGAVPAFIPGVSGWLLIGLAVAGAAVAASPLWAQLWWLGGLMICVGGYWFWFFIRVDVAAEGNSPFRLVKADLFILSLLASATLGLVWAFLQANGMPGSGLLFALYLVRDVMRRDTGTPKMREISDAIKAGAEAFLPPAVTDNQAVFVYEELVRGDWTGQFGARVERQKVTPESASGLAARSHTGETFTAGLIWRVSQGGSTLTQQLVKNFYLDSERTVTRKLNEVVMSVLLDTRREYLDILLDMQNGHDFVIACLAILRGEDPDPIIERIDAELAVEQLGAIDALGNRSLRAVVRGEVGRQAGQPRTICSKAAQFSRRAMGVAKRGSV